MESQFDKDRREIDKSRLSIQEQFEDEPYFFRCSWNYFKSLYIEFFGHITGLLSTITLMFISKCKRTKIQEKIAFQSVYYRSY